MMRQTSIGVRIMSTAPRRFFSRLTVMATLSFLVAAGARPALGQRVLRHRAPTFAIEIPAGFSPNGVAQLPMTLYAFAESSAASDNQLNFSVLDMGAHYDVPSNFTMNDIPPELRKGDFSIEQWMCDGVNLPAIVIRLNMGQLSFFSLTIQIPLIDNGIMITVAGPVNREADARKLFGDLLKSIKRHLYDPYQPVTTEELQRLIKDGAARMAAIPATLPDPAVSLYEIKLNGETCGWMKQTMSHQQVAGKPGRRLALEGLMLLPDSHSMTILGSVDMSPRFELRAAQREMTLNAPGGEPRVTTERVTADAKTVSFESTPADSKGETKKKRVTSHSVVACGPFIEALQLKPGDECAFVEFDVQKKTEAVRIARAFDKFGGRMHVDVYELSTDSRLIPSSIYIVNHDRKVASNLEVGAGLEIIRVTENVFQSLQTHYK
jgi:hypothetical protein